MIKNFIVAICCIAFFSQCQSSKSKTEKVDSTNHLLDSARLASHSDSISTEEPTQEITFTDYLGDDESKPVLGNQTPRSVWQSGGKSNNPISLYRYDQYDVMVDNPQDGETVGKRIRIFKTLMSVGDQSGNGHRLILKVPEKAAFSVPGDDKNGENGLAYYFLGLSKDYLFIDEGTDVQRSFHIYKLGSFKHIYSLSAYDIKLIGDHKIEFFKDTDLPADSTTCAGRMDEQTQQLYSEYPQQFVVVEKVTLDLLSKKIKKTGEVECQYRQ